MKKKKRVVKVTKRELIKILGKSTYLRFLAAGMIGSYQL